MCWLGVGEKFRELETPSNVRLDAAWQTIVVCGWELQFDAMVGRGDGASDWLAKTGNRGYARRSPAGFAGGILVREEGLILCKGIVLSRRRCRKPIEKSMPHGGGSGR